MDLCRQSLVFEAVSDLSACLRAILADPDVRLCRIKNRLDPEYDPARTAGYRDVALNFQAGVPRPRPPERGRGGGWPVPWLSLSHPSNPPLLLILFRLCCPPSSLFQPTPARPPPQLVTAQTVELGVESHVAELQLLLLPIARLKAPSLSPSPAQRPPYLSLLSPLSAKPHDTI